MRIALIIVFLFVQCLTQGQSLNFRNYSLEEGLSNSNATCLLQDQRGYLWIGTLGGGVNMFDGFAFTAFDKDDGLPGNEVRSILEDQQGNIWVGTNEGIAVYDGIAIQVIDTSDGLKGTNILCLYQHHDGTIWAGSDDGGLNRISGFGTDMFQIEQFDQSDGLSNNFIFDIAPGPDESIWLATFYGGIDIIHVQDDSIKVDWIKGMVDIPSELIICLEPDGVGGVWAGSYDRGLFHLSYDEPTSKFMVDTVFDNTSAVNDNSIWDLMRDQSGDLWIATNSKGLRRLSKDGIIAYTESNGLPNNQLLSLTSDKEGNLWVGTNGNGITQFRGEHFVHLTEISGFDLEQVYCTQQLNDGRLVFSSYGNGLAIQESTNDMRFRYLNSTNGLIGNYISSVTIDSADQIWAATENGVIRMGESNVLYTESDGLLSNVVNVIHADRQGVIWCGTKYGVSAIHADGIINITEDEGLSDNTVTDIIEDGKGQIWFATLDGMAKYHQNVLQTFDEEEGLFFKRINTLCEGPSGNIWIATNGGGLYVLDIDSKDSLFIHKIEDDGLSSSSYKDLVFADDSTLIAGFNRGFDKIILNEIGAIHSIKKYEKADGFIGVETNFNGVYRANDGKIWFGTPLGVTRYDMAVEPIIKSRPTAHINGLRLFYQSVDWNERGYELTPWSQLPTSLKLDYSEKQLTFVFTGIYLNNPSGLRFRHFLEGADEQWSPAQIERQVTYSGLSPGKYTFKVVAIDRDGNESEADTYSFEITPPWYQTPLFYGSSLVLILLLVFGYIRYREHKLKAEKEYLERVVKERTAKVVEQKEIIEHKNKDITDSINYARRIQDAMLPAIDEISAHFPESLVLFMPKDIVSGDFYWFSEHKGKVYFTASDCTGHGVPGAFMSMIGASLLNDAVNEKGLDTPALILNNVRQRIIHSLGQTGAEGQQKDGMDMALCAYRKSDGILEFAGANNPLYILRKSGNVLTTVDGNSIEPYAEVEGVALYEVKANKMPVGYYAGDQVTFDNHAFQTLEGDVVYSFSDGYPDQFGGPKGKKFKYSTLKQKLISIYHEPLEVQKTLLNEAIIDWMGTEEQIDDICFVAVRL